MRRDAIDTLGNDINGLFSILHWQYGEKIPMKAGSTPAQCPNNAGFRARGKKLAWVNPLFLRALRVL